MHGSGSTFHHQSDFSEAEELSNTHMGTSARPLAQLTLAGLGCLPEGFSVLLTGAAQQSHSAHVFKLLSMQPLLNICS